MARKRHFVPAEALLALATTFLLAACSSVKIEPQPSADLQVLAVGLSPELNWMAADLNSCAGSIPDLHLEVNPLPAGQTDPGSSDLLLLWGSEQGQGSQTFELGNETLQVIVNPANPLDSIQTGDLVSILGSKTVDWATIAPGSTLGAIQAWIYPQDSAAQALIEQNILQNNRLDPEILLAPGPQEMRELVAAAPGGIGFLPSHWVDQTVKTIAISDLPQGISQPLLAITAAQPGGDLRSLLLCLQSRLNG